MKTNNVGGSAGNKNYTKGGGNWFTTIGGNTPQPSKVPLLPKNAKLPFFERLKKWLTE